MNTEKRKYIKSGKFTKEEILKRKMERIFDRSKKLRDKAGESWNQKLENIQKSINEVKKDTTKKGKYVKTGKYIKSGKYTKDAILERKMVKLFEKFNKITKELKSEKGWYENLKKSIMNLFFKQDVKFELVKEALNGAAKRYVIDLKEGGLSLYDPIKVFGKVKPLVFKKFRENPITKQQLTFQCKMKKINLKTKEIEIKEPHFHSKQYLILEGNNFDEIYKKMQDEIILLFEKWISEKSQWIFQSSLKLYLNISKIKLLKGSSWVPLSEKIKNKKAIINPENYDQKCFLWCVVIHEVLKKHPNLKNLERLPKIVKKKMESYNINGMKFPCGFSDIDKFENNNNIAINISGCDESDCVFPL